MVSRFRWFLFRLVGAAREIENRDQDRVALRERISVLQTGQREYFNARVFEAGRVEREGADRTEQELRERLRRYTVRERELERALQRSEEFLAHKETRIQGLLQQAKTWKATRRKPAKRKPAKRRKA